LHQIDPGGQLTLEASAADYSISHPKVQWLDLATSNDLSTVKLGVGEPERFGPAFHTDRLRVGRVEHQLGSYLGTFHPEVFTQKPQKYRVTIY